MDNALIQGPDNAFDGLNRLQVDGANFAQALIAAPTQDDGGQTLLTATQFLSGLNVSREITVPNTGSQDFARTLDIFTNPTGSDITTLVKVVGNLGSDAATNVFATSEGLTPAPLDLTTNFIDDDFDGIVDEGDEFTYEGSWIGTDDADGTGTPAIIHYLNGSAGLQPSIVRVVGDNIEWLYNLTVPAGTTVRLAHFTILDSTQAGAIAAAETLVTAGGFGGEAAAFLSAPELASIKNFVFDVVSPTVSSTTPSLTGGTLPAGTVSLQINFSESMNAAAAANAANFELRRAGPNGLLGEPSGHDDVIVTLSASYNGGSNSTTLTFAGLPEDVYRLTVNDTLTDVATNALDGDANGTAESDYVRDFVVSRDIQTLTSPNNYVFDLTFGGFGAGQFTQGTNNNFDGLNRLSIDGTIFSPASSTSSAVDVVEATGTSYMQFGGGFTDVPGLSSSVTVDGTNKVRLSADLHLQNPQGPGAFHNTVAEFLVDGVSLGSRQLVFGQMYEYERAVHLEDIVTLSPGTHTIKVRVADFANPAGVVNSSGTYLSVVEFNTLRYSILDDGGRTVVTPTQSQAGLQVFREITVPSTGTQDFARTVDVFTNPTGSDITTTVTIVGNLGSDAATSVFNSSDGDTNVETTDQWIGTDDVDGTGTPAIVHYIHGPAGLKPTSVQVVGDNIEWTYSLTVAAGDTVRLAHFTILDSTQAGAIAAADALVTATGFGGEADAFLSGTELGSLTNFLFVADVNLSVSATTGTEAGTTVITVTATSSFSLGSDQTLDLDVTGVGIDADDYTLSGTTITIPNGQTTGTVTFTVKNDTLSEGDETATLAISNLSTGLKLGTTTTQEITIDDDDLTYSISTSATTVTEAAQTVTFTVNRSGSTNDTDSTVDFVITGSAAIPADYNSIGGTSGATTTSGTISFAAGETSKTITLNILSDTLAEGDETILTTLSNGTALGTATISTASATTTINDDDLAYSISTSATTVSETAQTVTFTISRTGSFNDAGSTVNFAITGTAVNGSDYNSIGGTGGATTTSGTVSFAAGEASKTITLNILDDSVFENTETIIVTLSSATAPGAATISTPAATTTITDNDRLLASDGAGGLIVQDGSGTRVDRLTVTYDAATNSLIFTDPNNPLSTGLGMVMNANTVRVPLSALTTQKLTFDLGTGDDKLDLRTVPSSFAILITGGDGNDTIYANNSGDTINGGNGNDSINGGTGNDTINGEVGIDTIFGGPGTDNITGGDGADYLSGDAGNDTISGGNHNDTLLGGDGDDSVTGDAGADSINGGNGNDTLDGGSENDTIRGSSGNDAILGGTGNDQLFGENDNDTISGGAGNDSILGGAGNDVLAGEAGADTVMGESGSDTIAGGSGSGKDVGDIVTDLPADIRETLRLVFSNGAFIVTL